VDIVPFRPELTDDVQRLIVGIQRDEFGIDITAEQQPDLRDIPAFYQVGSGNFWLAIADQQVVGTIALLDIGHQQGALRKMFVHRQFRGGQARTATGLLDTLMHWAERHDVRELFLGTTARFLAAHRFYEKNGFSEVATTVLPPAFPIMSVDTKFYSRYVGAGGERP
jgi:N-acetylglutamate synthase-like GNAT family acetyltransferase